MVEWGHDERRRMLDVLGLDEAEPTFDYLSRLTRRWLLTIPFHNLDLLVGESPRDEAGAAARCLRGRGGGCHVHAAGFHALLNSLGFEAHYGAATIGEPSDHLLLAVNLADKLYWVDVGNGQPYLQPFPDKEPTRMAHLGWKVRTIPTGRGVRLERRSPDQPNWREVYVTSSARKTWRDFSESIHRHHTEPGYGPFLTGLRVVNIASHSMTTLRDEQLTTYDAGGFRRTRLNRDEGLAKTARSMVPGRDVTSRAIREWRRHAKVTTA